MAGLVNGQDFAAIADRFEKAEDALRTLLDAGNGALAAKRELTDARTELDRSSAQARQEMAACRDEIAVQLDKTALEFREALKEILKALTSRIERSEAAAASVSESAQTALGRSQTAIDDVASQARQQSRTLTDIARDLKDAAAMLNSFRPEEITERLDGITADGKVIARKLGALAVAGRFLALAVAAFGALATAPYWFPIIEKVRTSLSQFGL